MSIEDELRRILSAARRNARMSSVDAQKCVFDATRNLRDALPQSATRKLIDAVESSAIDCIITSRLPKFRPITSTFRHGLDQAVDAIRKASSRRGRSSEQRRGPPEVVDLRTVITEHGGKHRHERM